MSELQKFYFGNIMELRLREIDKHLEKAQNEQLKDVDVGFSKFTDLPKKKDSNKNESASIVRFEPFINEPPRCSADEILKALEEFLKPPKPNPFGTELLLCPGPDDYVRQTSTYFKVLFLSAGGKVFRDGECIGTVEEYVTRWKKERGYE